MKKFILLPIFILLAGCVTPELSNLQRRSIESRDLEGNFDYAFKATLQVLQDRGYVIKNTDYKAGVIQGETGEKQVFWRFYNNEASVTMEQFGEGRVKIRVTFISKSSDGMSKHSNIIDDPKFLQEVYDAIQKEIFVRKNLSK